MFRYFSFPKICARTKMHSALTGTRSYWKIIREICEPYNHLMHGVREVRGSQTLQRLIAMTLSVGNEMNRTDIKSFAIESLLKLSSIKSS